MHISKTREYQPAEYAPTLFIPSKKYCIGHSIMGLIFHARNINRLFCRKSWHKLMEMIKNQNHFFIVVQKNFQWNVLVPKYIHNNLLYITHILIKFGYIISPFRDQCVIMVLTTSNFIAISLENLREMCMSRP